MEDYRKIAIELGQTLISKAPETKEDVERMLPELRESEDEKMRRWIINYLDNKALNSGIIQEKTNIKNAIAWLEKQGEQKPDTDFSDLRTWKYIVDAVWTEKEGIGQYLDSPFTEEIAKKLQKRFGNIEQKSVWSEEDEEEVAILEAYIRSKDWSERHVDRALGIVDKLVNKVKSLRPQNRWKPSEEQIEALESATANCDYSEYQDCLRELIGQLKKLK